MLWIEGDRLAFGLDAMTDENVARERAIVWREHQERVGLNPFNAADALLVQALFPMGHPLRAQAAMVAEPGSLRLDAARWFFQQWYAPGNAHLTVVGGFDPDVARAAIVQSFGDIPARAAPRRPDIDSVPSAEGAPDIQVEARAGHARLAIGWRTPAHRAPGDAELDVFRHVFAPSVERALLAAHQVVTAVSARQSSVASGSRFVLTVDLGLGATTDQVRPHVLRAVTNVLRRCEADGWFEAAREAELTRYRSPPTSLRVLAEDLARDRDPEDPGGYVRDVDRFTAVDRAGTCAAARRLLDPGRGVMLQVDLADDAPMPYRRRSRP